MRIELEVPPCEKCPGDGVVRPTEARAGIDWPTPCVCGARKMYTQYTLGRLLDEDPQAIVRVHEVCARGDVSARVFNKMAAAGLIDEAARIAIAGENR